MKKVTQKKKKLKIQMKPENGRQMTSNDASMVSFMLSPRVKEALFFILSASVHPFYYFQAENIVFPTLATYFKTYYYFFKCLSFPQHQRLSLKKFYTSSSRVPYTNMQGAYLHFVFLVC